MAIPHEGVGRLIWRASMSEMVDEIKITREPPSVQMLGRFTGLWAEVNDAADFESFRAGEQQQAAVTISHAKRLKKELAGRLRWARS